MEPPATSLSTHHPANPPVAPSCRAAGGVTEPPAWSQPRARCYSAVQGQLRLTGEEVGQTRPRVSACFSVWLAFAMRE